MSKLPVSIISPVRNCIGEMPAHAEHLRGLSRIATELIIVDSDSSDGTMDYLKDQLADCGAVFLNHPPGLYPSWNHGISHASQPYLTVATVGDTLPPDSLMKLHRSLETSDADVVISAPILLNPDGSRSDRRWPVHRLIAACDLSAPRPLSQATWLALTLGFFPKSPLASSSGNLYRTEVFKENLFSTDCGHRGDVVWGITSARGIRWLVDPTVESYFKFHPPAAHREPPSPSNLAELNRAVMAAHADGLEFLKREGVAEWFLAELRGMLEDSCRSLVVEAEYSIVRRNPLPWFFNPRAIRLRKQRKLLKRKNSEKNHLLTRFMKSLDASGTGPL